VVFKYFKWGGRRRGVRRGSWLQVLLLLVLAILLMRSLISSSSWLEKKSKAEAEQELVSVFSEKSYPAWSESIDWATGYQEVAGSINFFQAMLGENIPGIKVVPYILRDWELHGDLTPDQIPILLEEYHEQ
jgi:high-affinity Fe2+/Pb2+ permease